MDLEKIKKLAEEKADSQERRGTSAWNGIYHGFIFGWQASEHPLPRPLECWNKARELDCGDYIEWHLEKERGNAR